MNIFSQFAHTGHEHAEALVGAANAASTANDGSVGPTLMFGGASYLLMVIAFWAMFTKAGEKGWKALIPIYNLMVYCKVAGRPMWWGLLFWVPLVGLVMSLFVALDISKAFGRGKVMAIVGVWIFAPIGQLILGLGDAKYKKPAAK